jgi:hypothetical protein
MIQKNLRSLDAVRADGNHGPLSAIVFRWLEIMEDVVNRPKGENVSAKEWAPLAALVDTASFERIGNYGEQVNWEDYVTLLAMWANSSWWKGRIWRIWEVPGFVFCETEERSRPDAPVDDSGGYHALNSFCVYEFDENSRVRHLYIYDQRPLDGPPAGHLVPAKKA